MKKLIWCFALFAILVFSAQADEPYNNCRNASKAEDAKASNREKYPLTRGWDYVLIHSRFGGEDELLDADDVMCQQLKSYMNNVAPNWVKVDTHLLVNYCTSAARIAPIFTEPPWSELDPHQYEELIARLLRYQAEGADRYFSSEPWEFRREDSYYHTEAHKFIEQGGRLQYWKTRLQDFLDDPIDHKNKPASAGDQHIIQLRYTVDYSIDENFRQQNCRRPNWRGSVFLVTEDLNGPERIVNGLMADSTLLTYAGDPVLLTDSVEEVRVQNANNTGTTHSCRLVHPQEKLEQEK